MISRMMPITIAMVTIQKTSASVIATNEKDKSARRSVKILYFMKILGFGITHDFFMLTLWKSMSLKRSSLPCQMSDG